MTPSEVRGAKPIEQAWNKHAAELHALALQDPPTAGRGKIGKGKAGKPDAKQTAI